MILLLSGEGPSDIGTCRTPTGTCDGADFKPGPMACIIDKLVESEWNYSPLATSSCSYVSEGTLAYYCREHKLGMVLPGKKKLQGTGYFYKNARGLARLAREHSARLNCPVGAVLFRDSDGTVNSPPTLWSEKVKSMEFGFEAEDFELGVPMVPKPKSEAWLLCAIQAIEYQNCARFEDLPGNDASPNSAKAKLEKALNAKGWSYQNICDKVESGEISPQRIQMPSFDSFKGSLVTVAQRMKRRA